MLDQNKKNDVCISVLLPLPFHQGYDYLVPSGISLKRGNIVSVEFGKKKLIGVVWALNIPSKVCSSKLKYISNHFSEFSLTIENIHFLEWASDYTMMALGNFLKMMMSVSQAFIPLKHTRILSPPQLPDLSNFQKSFNNSQQAAIESIRQNDLTNYSVTLLDGVTGSGKTDVYLELLYNCFKEGKQALIMLPQIALAPQIADRFEKRYGAAPTLWHSSLTPSQRRQSWKHILAGDAKIVIGARSALFLPFANLGMIIVDEEHDHAYKQEDVVIYQARDLAVARAYLAKIPCVLVSATPSQETWLNCKKGRYKHVQLSTRYGGAILPHIHFIDLRHKHASRHNKRWISPLLTQKIKETVEKGDQTLLYLNRRGYAPLTLCGACGQKLQCPFCSCWLVDHLKYNKLLCHHCGHNLPRTRQCQKCGEPDSFVSCGPGVERIAEEISHTFPTFRVAIVSSDNMDNEASMKEFMQKMESQEIDVIIGTQMIAKGHHFPHLTLVGILDADLGLSGGDLRASEKTYQLLHQVAGRAGRAQKPGHVYFQTYNPEHPIFTSLIQENRESFIEQELEARRQGMMPPFSRLASLIFTSTNQGLIENSLKSFIRCQPHQDEIMVWGPAPAPFFLLRGKFRWRILIRALNNHDLKIFIYEWVKKYKFPSSIKMKIDIDPYSFL